VAVPVIVGFSVGLLAGLLAGLCLSGAGTVMAPLGAALAAVAWIRFGSRAAGAAVLATGVASGSLWGEAASLRARRDCRLLWRDGQRLSVVVEPTDVSPDGTPNAFRVMEPSRCRGRIIVAPATGLHIPARVVALTGTWRRDDRAARSVHSGPRLPLATWRAGRLVTIRALPIDRSLSLRSRLRIGAGRRFALLLGRELGALAAALTVSAEAEIPAAVRERFARSGLAHLLSISGFHVGILAAAIVVVIRAARAGPDTSLMAGTLLVAGYVWLLGFPAPALRAAGLLALWSWARLRQRPVAPQAPLAVAAVLVLAADPFATGSAGAWLSFAGAWGCVAAARWWGRLWREARERRTRGALRVLQAVAVSFGATLATAPVSVMAFGTVSPVAPLANVVAIPLAAFVVPALAVSLAVATLPLPGALAVASLPASAASLGLSALDRVAVWAAGLPLAQVSFEGRLLAATVLAALAYLVLRPATRFGVDGRRGGTEESSARLVMRRLVLAAGLAGVAAVWWPLAPARASGYRAGWLTVHFLDVGQGDAAVMRTPAGRWIVVDGGPRTPGYDAGARVLVPFLKRERAGRVALVVASHGDADHLGGLPSLLSQIPADLGLEPGDPLGRPLYREWLARLAGGGVRWLPARAGDSISIDGVTVRIWHPDPSWLERRMAANENSVVMTVEFGAFRALFPGDAGLPMEAERAEVIGDVTLLKVGHHGSRTATGSRWLDAVRPEVCVVSVGRGNRYGHPAPETLARLAGAACATLRTDREGTVTVETDGRVMRLLTKLGRDTTLMIEGGRR
jgi:competence protein ComEC